MRHLLTFFLVSCLFMVPIANHSFAQTRLPPERHVSLPAVIDGLDSETSKIILQVVREELARARVKVVAGPFPAVSQLTATARARDVTASGKPWFRHYILWNLRRPSPDETNQLPQIVSGPVPSTEAPHAVREAALKSAPGLASRLAHLLSDPSRFEREGQPTASAPPVGAPRATAIAGGVAPASAVLPRLSDPKAKGLFGVQVGSKVTALPPGFKVSKTQACGRHTFTTLERPATQNNALGFADTDGNLVVRAVDGAITFVRYAASVSHKGPHEAALAATAEAWQRAHGAPVTVIKGYRLSSTSFSASFVDVEELPDRAGCKGITCLSVGKPLLAFQLHYAKPNGRMPGVLNEFISDRSLSAVWTGSDLRLHVEIGIGKLNHDLAPLLRECNPTLMDRFANSLASSLASWAESKGQSAGAAAQPAAPKGLASVKSGTAPPAKADQTAATSTIAADGGKFLDIPTYRLSCKDGKVHRIYRGKDDNWYDAIDSIARSPIGQKSVDSVIRTRCGG